MKAFKFIYFLFNRKPKMFITKSQMLDLIDNVTDDIQLYHYLRKKYWI